MRSPTHRNWRGHPSSPQVGRSQRGKEHPAQPKIKLIAAILMTSKQILVVWISLVNFRPTFYWSLNTFPSLNNSFKTEFWIFPSKPSYCHSSLNQQQHYFAKLLKEKTICVNLDSFFFSLPHLVSNCLANLLGSAFKTFRMQQLLLPLPCLYHYFISFSCLWSPK